jgi:hypothetical protein
MKSLLFCTVILAFLVGCTSTAPPESAIQTAIAQTQAVKPAVATPKFTNTAFQAPTNTPKPSNTPTQDPCPHNEAVLFRESIFASLEKYNNAAKLIGITTVSSLIAQASMIETEMELNKIDYPQCGKPVYDTAITFMDAGIDWANVIINNGNSSEIKTKFSLMIEKLKLFAVATSEFDKTAGITPVPTDIPAPTDTPAPTLDMTKEAQINLIADKPAGYYLIGIDIAPGLWRSKGKGEGCYWATTDKKGEIIDNDLGLAGMTAYISPEAFQVKFGERCGGDWVYLGPP